MTIKKRPRGAPKKMNPALRRFDMRITDQQHVAWSNAAKKQNLSLSSWLKSIADNAT